MLRLALLIRCGVTYRSSRFANSHSFLTYFRELWCYLQLASWLGCSSTTTPARLLRPVSLPKSTKTLAEDWRKLWYEGGGVAHRGPLLPVHLAPRAGHCRCGTQRGTNAVIMRPNRFRPNLTLGTTRNEGRRAS